MAAMEARNHRENTRITPGSFPSGNHPRDGAGSNSVPVMRVQPDRAEIELGPAAEVDWRVLLRHAERREVRESLEGRAVVLNVVTTPLKDDETRVFLPRR